METKNFTIGTHEVILKSEILKKDILPLSRLNNMKLEGNATEEAISEDPTIAMEATDVLVELFVVSIDGKIERKDVKEIVDCMSINEFTSLIQAITENMKDFEKKSLN